MFHVKHNNKDNILHVYIGTHARTGTQAHRQAGRQAGAGRPDEPVDAPVGKQATERASKDNI